MNLRIATQCYWTRLEYVPLWIGCFRIAFGTSYNRFDFVMYLLAEFMAALGYDLVRRPTSSVRWR